MKHLTTLLVTGTLALAGWAQAPEATGEITRIDKAQGRVTLRHGEIRHLDMPPMTMAYRVREARWLDSLSVGARVRFVAEKVDGHYVITQLRPAP